MLQLLISGRQGGSRGRGITIVLNEPWPQDVFLFILTGEAQDLYQVVHLSARQCLEDIQLSIQEKEIEEAVSRFIEKTVQDELTVAGETRYALSRVDNKLRQEEKIYTGLCRQLKADTGERDTVLEVFFTLPSIIRLKYETVPEFVSLQALVAESYRYRLQNTECWDVILVEHRKVLVNSAMMVGQKLSLLALSSQDDETIDLVHSLLKDLDLKIPHQTRLIALPPNPEVLQPLLIKGIKTIETLQKKIAHVDRQRKELRATHERLAQQHLLKSMKSAGGRGEEAEKEAPGMKKTEHRMIYPNENRDPHR